MIWTKINFNTKWITFVIRQYHFGDDNKPLNMILDDGGDLTGIVHDKYPELTTEYLWY